MSEDDKQRARAKRLGQAVAHSLTERKRNGALSPAPENELVELAHRLKDYGVRPGTVATLAIRALPRLRGRAHGGP